MSVQQRSKLVLCIVIGLAVSGCGGDGGYQSETRNGVKYTDIKEGEGPGAKFGDLLFIRYVSRLPNGQPFEDTRQEENPRKFRLGFREMVDGVDEGLAGMKAGGMRKLWVPSKLGYGPKDARQFPVMVPANSDLTYEFELVRLVSKEDYKAEEEKERQELEKAAKQAPSGTEISEAEQKVITTPSGLKYVDLRVGNGPVARPGQSASVNYVGKLTSGAQFDSSYDRHEPFLFPLGRGKVIKGWDEGVVGMKVGGKRRLMIPAELGYGSRGAGDKIPANSDLVFEIELLRLR